MPKKINPRRKPCSEADVAKAVWFTCRNMKILSIQAALDEGIAKPEDVQRYWNRMSKLADELKEGRIKIQEVYDVLVDEYGLEDI